MRKYPIDNTTYGWYCYYLGVTKHEPAAHMVAYFIYLRNYGIVHY
jgi:hypothetical protein